MPPKRDADVFDDATLASADPPYIAGSTRGGKKKRFAHLSFGVHDLTFLTAPFSPLFTYPSHLSSYRLPVGKSADEGQASGPDAENV